MNPYARRPPLRTMGADRNAGDLADLWRSLPGAKLDVLPGGDGRPDFLLGAWGITGLAEVKPEVIPGKVSASEAALRPSQKRWRETWTGSAVALWRTRDDVLATYEDMRQKARRMGR